MKKTMILLFLLLISTVSAQVCDKLNTPALKIQNYYELNEGEQFFLNLSLEREMDVNYSFIPINSGLEILLGEGMLYTDSKSAGHHTFFILANTFEGCYDLEKITFKVYQRPNITYYSPDYLKLQMPENTAEKFIVAAKDVEYYWYLDDKLVKNSSSSYIFRSNYTSSGNKRLAAVVKDKRGLNRTLTWRISIDNINRRPFVKYSIPDILLTKDSRGEILNFNDYIYDPDGDELRFNFTFVDEKNNRLNGSKVFDVLITDMGSLRIAPKADILRKEYLSFEASDGVTKTTIDQVSIELVLDQNKTVFSKNIDFELCEVEISCEEWSECYPQGIKARLCRDLNNCNGEYTNITETEACEYGATCTDGIKNQDEEEVDCGGPCRQCPSCSDKFQNQGEEGIDCGGPCISCPSCTDLIKNQDETDIDCGGICRPCISGLACSSHKDCESFVCFENACQSATCIDGRRNQGEEKTDCGGPCEKCPSCNDGILNQGEEEVDCGGPCRSCMSCSDEIKNQDEVFTDCGGVCPCKSLEFYESNKIILFALIFILAFSIILNIIISRNYTAYLLKGSKLLDFLPSRIDDYNKHSHEAISALRKLQLQLSTKEYYKVNEEYKKIIHVFFEKILSFENFDDISFKRELKSKIKNPYKRKLFFVFHQFTKKSTGSSTLFKLEMNEKIDATIRKIEMLK